MLLSFSTLEWDVAALAPVRALRDYEFFAVKPLAWEGPNLHAVDRCDVCYSNVLASCDVVLTKPGYGVLSECAVIARRLAFVDSTDWSIRTVDGAGPAWRRSRRTCSRSATSGSIT